MRRRKKGRSEFVKMKGKEGRKGNGEIVRERKKERGEKRFREKDEYVRGERKRGGEEEKENRSKRGRKRIRGEEGEDYRRAGSRKAGRKAGRGVGGALARGRGPSCYPSEVCEPRKTGKP